MIEEALSEVATRFAGLKLNVYVGIKDDGKGGKKNYVKYHVEPVPEPIASLQMIEWVAWVKDNPCPGTAKGEATINDWIFDAAKEALWCKLDPAKAENLIRPLLTRRENGQEIQNAIKNAYKSSYRSNGYRPKAPEPEPYNEKLLTELVEPIMFDVCEQSLAERSPIDPRTCSTLDFLDTVFAGFRHVWCGAHDKAPGWIYEVGNRADGQLMVDDLQATLDPEGRGPKFLINPINGEQNADGKWRTGENIVAMRHLILESDKDRADLWLAFLCTLPLPIVAIYDSANRGPHALVRVDATSEDEFKATCEDLRQRLVPYGLDKKSCNKVVQLSRLPGFIRQNTGKEQKLLYLNPSPERKAIWQEKEARDRYQTTTGKLNYEKYHRRGDKRL